MDLAKRAFPSETILELEEKWGDFLVEQRQYEAAYKHFVEAFKYEKAMKAASMCDDYCTLVLIWAVAAKQWDQVLQVADSLETSEVHEPLLHVAKTLAETGDYNTAERFFIKSGHGEDAITMHLRAGHVDVASKLSRKLLSDHEAKQLFETEATKLAQQANLRDAERLYIAAGEPDVAISMYSKLKRYDDMLRLEAQFHKDRLPGVYAKLATEMEKGGQLRQAEQYFVQANDWAVCAMDLCIIAEHDASRGLLRCIATTSSGKMPCALLVLTVERPIGNR